jgi:hypothetical protein
MATLSRFDTHEVFNQSPPYENVDLFASAAALTATAPAAVADAFIQSRLSARHGAIYGASGLRDSTIELLLQRALPEA